MRKPPPTPGTRDRILETARTLLNETSFDRVTTRLIADTAAINEGNLYYHFRTKQALVTALFARFETEATALLDAPPIPEPGLLRRWFLLTWRYRFLFRDAHILQAAAPGLERNLPALITRLQDGTRNVFHTLAQAGLIAIEPEPLDRLVANIAIVSSYWISYLRLQSATPEITETHLAWGFEQLRSLYAPYLTDAGRNRLLAPGNTL